MLVNRSKVIRFIKNLTPERVKKVYRNIFIVKSNGKKTIKFSKERGLMRKLEQTGKRFTPTLFEFPPQVLLDTTTRCNLSCSHCPSSTLQQDENWKGDMDIALYKKAIDEIAEANPDTIVRPFNSGEPLMRKDCEDQIKYAKDKGIKTVSLTTNGLILNSKRAKTLIESGLDDIEFSIDAITPETYLKIRHSELYDRLMKNIEYFIQLKNKLRPQLLIKVSFVKQKDNLNEVEQFKNYWHSRVDEIIIREYHEHNELVGKEGRYEKKQRKHRHPCPYLWDRIIIQHDGSVRFCEADWKAENTVIGNLNKESLRDIWLNNAYTDLRRSHIEGSFIHPFCKKCTDWQEIKW